MAHGLVVPQNFSSKKTILAAYLMLCIKVFLSSFNASHLKNL